MSRLPIRLRLTLAFAAAMAVVLAALGLIVYTRFADSLEDNVDRSLRARATDTAAVVERSGGRIVDSGPGRFIESEESFAQVLDSGGRVVDGTTRAESRPLLDPDDLRRARGGSLTLDRDDAVEAGDSARLFAVPVGRFTLVVGQATDDNEEALATLRLLLLTALPITLLLASLGAYALAGRALRPVAQALERERGFVADASHELRTPLANLKTEIELALREGRSADELRAALASASEDTDRLVRLADDLLVLARSDRGALPLKLELVPVRDLLERVARGHRTMAGEIVVDAPGELAVRGDPLRLEQALGNLIANAAVHGAPPVRISAAQNGEHVTLHVEDRGEGIPADFAERAFERFTRVDSSRTDGGAGLGLAIVDAVARAHGGSAGSSPSERGADVWISLPALIDGSSTPGTTAP